MSAEPAVQVEDVSKRFSRNLKRALWYGVHDIAKELVGVGQEADRLRRSEFWALRDVSFSIGRGESVGLIGHNGAGKSTMLKLINGLIKPSHGRITVRGSVRALIALGTGFNPVLTGRENIRVASAVIGSIDSDEAIDAIIEFSEIGDFIDSPVQSYSSGMLARLGFAVAVHTQPDILLVDEVLAVGDLNFAIKCYRKIAEFRNAGGSVILVSHNPYTIRTNCERVIWLERGVIQAIGGVGEICDEYEAAVARQDSFTAGDLYSDGTVELLDLVYPKTIRSGEPFTLELELEAKRTLAAPIFAVTLSTASGQPVVANASLTDRAELSIEQGRNVIRLTYDSLPLVGGLYSISVVAAEGSLNNQRLAMLNLHRFEVVGSDDYGAGILRLMPAWQHVT